VKDLFAKTEVVKITHKLDHWEADITDLNDQQKVINVPVCKASIKNKIITDINQNIANIG